MLKSDIIDHIDSIIDNSEDEDQIKKLNALRNHILYNDSDDINENDIKKLKSSIGFFDKFKESLESDVDIDPGRILGLSDGIFGMVMTILVFGMALPEANLLTSGDFVSFIYSIAPIFVIQLSVLFLSVHSGCITMNLSKSII